MQYQIRNGLRFFDIIGDIIMFGGNPNMSHFSVSVRYRVRNEKGEAENTKEQQARRNAERAKLKQEGIKETTYFQFHNKDADSKAKAKVEADKLAEQIEKQTGVVMEVAEGCFL